MVASEYRRCTISLVLCALQAYGAWTVDMCHIKLCKSITMLDFHVSLVDSSCLGLMACLNQRAWHLNDHGTPHFGWGHREVHGLQPTVFWRAEARTVNPHSHHKFCHAYLQEPSGKEIPTIPTNIIHTCHVGFRVDFFIRWKCYGLRSKTTLI